MWWPVLSISMLLKETHTPSIPIHGKYDFVIEIWAPKHDSTVLRFEQNEKKYFLLDLIKTKSQNSLASKTQVEYIWVFNSKNPLGTRCFYFQNCNARWMKLWQNLHAHPIDEAGGEFFKFESICVLTFATILAREKSVKYLQIYVNLVEIGIHSLSQLLAPTTPAECAECETFGRRLARWSTSCWATRACTHAT